jgi:outer membrane protein OmpA-like peptidoglycan-associated protein
MRRVVLLSLLLLAGCGTFGLNGGAPRYVVFFDPFSAQLDEAAVKVVAEAAGAAKRQGDVPVTVIGYADPEGSAQTNRDLSRTRAGVVADALMHDGVPGPRIRRQAMGAVDYSLDSLESRRVEIVVGGE